MICSAFSDLREGGEGQGESDWRDHIDPSASYPTCYTSHIYFYQSHLGTWAGEVISSGGFVYIYIYRRICIYTGLNAFAENLVQTQGIRVGCNEHSETVNCKFSNFAHVM